MILQQEIDSYMNYRNGLILSLHNVTYANYTIDLLWLFNLFTQCSKLSNLTRNTISNKKISACLFGTYNKQGLTKLWMAIMLSL